MSSPIHMWSTLREYLVTPRPSKQFFYDLLIRDAKQISLGAWVLDLATQQGKNRSLFRSAKYIAADIDPRALPPAGERVFPLVTDIRKPGIRQDSVDVVVSTHTLSHLSWDKRFDAIQLLASCVKPSGSLIFNITLREKGLSIAISDVMKLLAAEFDLVRSVLYRSVFDRVYEDMILEFFRPILRKNRLVNRFFRLFGFLLFAIERVARLNRVVPSEAYFVFRKRGQDPKESLSFYDIIACPKDRSAVHLSGNSVTCTQCGSQYMIADNVPNLIVRSA